MAEISPDHVGFRVAAVRIKMDGGRLGVDIDLNFLMIQELLMVQF